MRVTGMRGGSNTATIGLHRTTFTEKELGELLVWDLGKQQLRHWAPDVQPLPLLSLINVPLSL